MLLKQSRTYSQVLLAREHAYMGCCERFADRKACNCLEESHSDIAPRQVELILAGAELAEDWRDSYRVAADAAEEAGEEILARGLRWMAERGRKPWRGCDDPKDPKYFKWYWFRPSGPGYDETDCIHSSHLWNCIDVGKTEDSVSCVRGFFPDFASAVLAVAWPAGALGMG